MLIILWLVAAVIHGGEWLCQPSYLGSAIAMTYIFRLAIASDSVQLLAEARTQGALELLFSTPLTAEDIARGQRLALRRSYQGPLIVVAVILFCLFLAGLNEREMSSNNFQWVLLWTCGTIVFVVDLVTIFHVGLWNGISSPNLQHAFGQTMFQVFVFPWVMYGLLCSLLAFAVEWLLRVRFNPPEWTLVLLWFLISLGLNSGFAIRCRHRFLTESRKMAMTRFQKRLPFWQKWMGATESTQGN